MTTSADKVEPIYRPTTLNTALYDFHARKCVLYIGPPSENVILAEYDLFPVCVRRKDNPLFNLKMEMELTDNLRRTLQSHAEGSTEVRFGRGSNGKVIGAVNSLTSSIKQWIHTDNANIVFDMLLDWLNQGRNYVNSSIYMKCAKYVLCDLVME